MNYVNSPGFTRDLNKTILEVVPPLEVHLVLEVLKKLLNHMLLEFNKTTSAWANVCYVQQQVTHGSSSYNRNACIKVCSF